MEAIIDKKNKLRWFDAILPLFIIVFIQVVANIVALIYFIVFNPQAINEALIFSFDEFLKEMTQKLSGVLSWATFLSFVASLVFIFLYIKLRKIDYSSIKIKSFPVIAVLFSLLFNALFFISSMFYDKFLMIVGQDGNGQIDDLIRLFGSDIKGLILLGLTIVLLAPIVEETVFRGFLFNYLDNKYGFLKGAVISSFIFAIVHLYFIQIPIFFLIGFGLAYLTKKFDSIWPAVLTHFVNNAALFVIIFVVKI